MIDYTEERFGGTVSSGWIRDLESSDSRIHKEKTIEKALMAARLGSSDAQAFLFNCYQAYNPFYTFHIKQVFEVMKTLKHGMNLYSILLEVSYNHFYISY